MTYNGTMAEGKVPRGEIVKFILLLVTLVAFATPSFASVENETRVALVIGNSQYEHVSALTNPTNDADIITESLTKLGFEVTKVKDADYSKMRLALRKFSDVAQGADVALVYYAGHGIEVNKNNFLIPVDAALAKDTDVEFEAMPLELINNAVSGAKKLRLILLDACRDNPFASSMTRTLSTRSIGRGLARIEPTGATLVSYAAKEGTTAADGDGENSPYTTALVKYLAEPGLEIQFMFRKIRDSVLASTNGGQEPFTYGSLPGSQIYLNPVVKEEKKPEPAPVAVVPNPAPGNDFQVQMVYWNSIEASNEPELYKGYLAKYPDGHFAAIARIKLRNAEQKDTNQPQRQLSQDASVIERTFWDSIKDLGSVEMFENYLQSFPNGHYSAIANFQISRLKLSVALDPTTKQKAVPAKPKPATKVAALEPPKEIVKVAKLEPPKEVKPKKAEKVPVIGTGKLVAKKPVENKQVASLNLDEIKVEPKVEAEPKPQVSKRDIVRGIQKALNRVGCKAGAEDGLWGRGSIRALRRYASKANVSLASVEPTYDVYQRLLNESGRICPLECSVRQVEKNGQCVAKTCGSNESLNSKGICIASLPKAKAPPKKKKSVTPKATTKKKPAAKKKTVSKPQPTKQKAKRKPAPAPKKQPTRKKQRKQRVASTGCGVCVMDPADNSVASKVCGATYKRARSRGWCSR